MPDTPAPPPTPRPQPEPEPLAEPMGPDDVLVIATQDFALLGKDLYLASHTLTEYLSRTRRHGIIDGYAGPARTRPETGTVLNDLNGSNPASGDPSSDDPAGGDPGGGVLTLQVEVVAASRDTGASTAVETMHRAFHALGVALPNHYTPDEIQLLTIAIGGADLHIICLDRDAAHHRAGITP